MKFCPECRESFPDVEELCPSHGARLFAITAPPKPDYDALVGQTIDGRYTLDAKIGEGGMGVVYSAHHAILSKRVAVKVLKREVARDGSVVKRFIQEARAASTIGHANIADVHDFGLLPDGHSYFVMDFVVGPTLSRVLRDEGQMAPGRALPIIAQLARALGAAHEKGIVHRDLKPENIFVIEYQGQRDFVKIVDFGIAQMAPEEGGTRLTRAGMVFGTPEYMAPEQAAGREIDHRVDVYALGAILFEMMTGAVPFKGESVMATLAKVIMDLPPRPSDLAPHIHPAVEMLIEYAMAKDRDQRCPDMRALLMAIEECGRALAADGVPVGPMQTSGSGSVSASQASTIMEGQIPPSGALRALRMASTGSVAARKDPTGTRRATPPGLRSWPGGGAPPDAKTAALEIAPTLPPPGSRRGLAIGLVIGVAVLTVTGAMLLRGGGGSKAGASQPDAGFAAVGDSVDGGLVAMAAPDAALVGLAAMDAQVVVRPTPDAGATATPSHDENVTIQIKTDPPGSLIEVGGDNIGKGKATIVRKKGTKLQVVCSQIGFINRTITVVFKKDGVAVCKQAPHCDPDLQNPNPLAKCP